MWIPIHPVEVFCMLILVAMGGTYLLENPLNSLVALHPRYVWLVERLLEHNIPDPWLAFRASGVTLSMGCEPPER